MNAYKTIRTTLIGSLCAAGAIAQTNAAPAILRDLDPTPVNVLGSEPREFTELGSQVLFTAETAQHGRELWTLDSQTGAASLLLDIAPGAASGAPHTLVAFDGYVWFSADDGVHGSELWRSDGTPTGTELFADLRSNGGAFVSDLIAVDSQLFFAANVDGAGRELVVTDGTPAGTVTLDIAAGALHSAPRELTQIAGEVWFTATTPATGRELWRSAGTPASTTLIADSAPGSDDSEPTQLQDLGGIVLFLIDGEVWRTDGTAAGTSYLADGGQLTHIGNTGYYTNGLGLYSTDGSPANTQLVATLPLPAFGFVSRLTSVGSRVLVHALAGFWSLTPTTFSSDGTAAGTIALPQVVPSDYVVNGDVGYYASFDGGTFGSLFNGAQIWRTDGTAAGTSLALQVSASSADGHPDELAILGVSQRLLFSAVDGGGREPWYFDPVSGSGQRLVDLGDDNGHTAAGGPGEIVDAAGTAVLQQIQPTTALFTSDGTEAGTIPIMPPGSAEPLNPNDLLTVGTRTFFRTHEPPIGYRLWTSDGSAAGTVVLDLGNNTYPNDLVVAEDLLYFTCQDQFLRTNMWRTDGTQQGTFEVVPRPEWGGFGPIQPLGRGVVFVNPTYAQGAEPYYNDGTPGGTVMLGDLEPGQGNSSPYGYATLGDRCYFGVLGGRLAVTDGTALGTNEVLTGLFSPPTRVSNLFASRDRLWFTTSTPTGSVDLWVSDGTSSGTHLILPLSATPSSQSVRAYHQFGDDLLLDMWKDGKLGLWRSNGTTAGTTLVHSGHARSITVAGEREAWFVFEDLVHGLELWRTDGTAAGTALFADLMPGPASSFPRQLTVSGGRLLFSAEHPQLGVEPWSLQLHATSQDVGYGCTPTTTVPPSMWSDDPVLGATADLHIAHGPTPGLGVAMISNYTTSTHPLGSGVCDYFVDAGLAFWGFGATAGGNVSLPLAIPNSPTLEGARFRLQALTIPIAGLFAAELSNGVTLTIGR